MVVEVNCLFYWIVIKKRLSGNDDFLVLKCVVFIIGIIV